ncbi:alpha/beta hydrolase [uncultured Erythrobacter sp.]|uniref:alpha/beta fold hydrolase n=1 Tax=uncultured Erythrobacter sp. TaxID=263913 RepID=UPI002620E1CC|nr:alpha/beta hydrolase [uncultured Erythrobacter sp.]
MKWVLRILGVLVALLVVVFLVFRVPDTDRDAMRAKYGGEPSQFVTLANGQEVHLRDEGPRDALPIILLHGSAADLHTWQPWADGLSSDYRVIRYDQIGHGLTGPAVGGTYTLADFTGDVERIADHLGLERFVLGGNSMGGWVTAGYALENPERLAGIVLVDASGSPVRRTSGSGGNTGFSIATTPVLNQGMRFITPRSIIERSLSQSVSNQEIVTPEAVDRYWELLRYPGNRAATIDRFATKRVVYSDEDIRSLTMPTLILWGEEDALTPVEAGTWYHKRLPSSSLIAYPGIGHLPHEEAPEATLTDLRAWLNTLEPEVP